MKKKTLIINHTERLIINKKQKKNKQQMIQQIYKGSK